MVKKMIALIDQKAPCTFEGKTSADVQDLYIPKLRMRRMQLRLLIALLVLIESQRGHPLRACRPSRTLH